MISFIHFGRCLALLLLITPTAHAADEDCSTATTIMQSAIKIPNDKPKQRVAALTKAKGYCPTNVAILYNLGLAHYANNAKAEAKTTWQAALTQDPTDIKTRNNLAFVTMELGDAPTALQLIKAAPAQDNRLTATGSKIVETLTASLEQRHQRGADILREASKLKRDYPQYPQFQALIDRVLRDTPADTPPVTPTIADAPVIPLPPAAVTTERLDEQIQALPLIEDKDKNPHAYALIIGISQYQNPQSFTPLRYAARDAQNMYALLARRGVFPNKTANIRLLLNEQATITKIKDGLAWLVRQGKVYKDSTILFYFSGHGTPKTKGNTTIDSLLMPVDAATVSTEEEGLAISIKGLKQQMNSINHSNVVSILDACYTGVGKAGRLVVDSQLYLTDKAVFAVAAQERMAREYEAGEQGAFSYFLTQAMMKVNPKEDGWIYLHDAYTEAKGALDRLGEQDPNLSPAQNSIRLIKR